VWAEHDKFVENNPVADVSHNYFTEICSGSEAGSYLRLIDFVYHSTLGLRVIKKKKKSAGHVDAFHGRAGFGGWGLGFGVWGSGFKI